MISRKTRVRTLLLGGFFTLFFLAMVMRIYWVQVVQADELVKLAQNVWEKDEVLRATRGSIVDRQSRVLAEDGPSYTVVLDPKFIDSKSKKQDVVKGLAPLLNKPEYELDAMASKRKENGDFFQWVEVRNEGWKIDAELADLIKEQFKPYRSYNNLIHLYEYGIYLEETQKRYYPSGRMASHLLGYYDKQGRAIMGLEAKFDSQLQGIPGKMVTEKDARGNELPNGKVSFDPAIDGKTLKLTIDKQIQSYIEASLEQAYRKWKPKNMSIVAADPKTGEILGMASAPNFNPNEYWVFNSQADFNNYAVSAQYEPGSTFKLVTLAAAVEQGIFKPNDTFQSGYIRVPGAVIHDHDNVGWGKISYLDGLKRSSNVAFVKLGYEMLGENMLREYIARFGFGDRTGIDVPGEAKGIVQFKYPSEIATATFGQGGVATTTIQQVAAFGAIANGGKLMKPYVVKEIVDSETGQVVESYEPTVVREVVSPDTARQVSELLEQVVSDQKIGTGRKAHIDGYRVAGKTGTANKVIDGKYSPNQWVVSFIGYAPVEDPQILIAVIADEPDLRGDYREGGNVTLPVFKEIMTQSLRYMGIKANEDGKAIAEKDSAVTVPDMSGMTVQAARTELERREMVYEVLGSGTTVLAQFPKSGTETGPMQRMYLLTQNKADIITPDFKGKSLRDALELCSLLELNCQWSGEGYVASQSVLTNNEMTLVLEPYKEPEAARTDDKKQAKKVLKK
jgi:penicillin-binding protein 2B